MKKTILFTLLIAIVVLVRSFIAQGQLQKTAINFPTRSGA